jgi:hypothetical protein
MSLSGHLEASASDHVSRFTALRQANGLPFGAHYRMLACRIRQTLKQTGVTKRGDRRRKGIALVRRGQEVQRKKANDNMVNRGSQGSKGRHGENLRVRITLIDV